MPTWFKFIVIFNLMLGASSANASTNTSYDPWMDKPVLGYLYSQPNLPAMEKDMARQVHLSSQQRRALAGIATAEQQELRQLDTRPSSKVRADVFNKKVLAIARHTDSQVRKTLGGQYTPFRGWLRSWWNRHS
ncbi:hypothetical protein [Deinococcus sp.]|uniref:hypothetical protein n=1 Tax=Deinococcus sp. TaxID=47478 RepID=UPI0025C26586|nr:hypothetical protein [Deinococcus sp.]